MLGYKLKLNQIVCVKSALHRKRPILYPKEYVKEKKRENNSKHCLVKKLTLEEKPVFLF